MDTQPSHAPSQVLADRFVLERVLGSGGMATVWSAHDRRLGRTVAVKVLRADLSEEHAGRIEREARAAARIDDPRVVTVLDLDHDADGTPFLVLEALSGRTLADELQSGALPLDRAERLARDLFGALGSAHAVGVLHRDIKPSNVLVDGDGFRITDFGIASMADETATSGDLMGTLVYLAPERFDGAAASPQSDVFAAAVVLYEALAGTQPFRGESTTDSLARLRSGRFDPLPTSVPSALAGAIGRALDPDPDRRPADAAEFAHLVETATMSATEPDAQDPTVAIDLPMDRTTRFERPAVAPMPVDRGPSFADRIDELHRSPRVSSFAGFARRPQTIFIGIALLLLVLVLIAAASGSDGASGEPDTGADPADVLDQQLDRLEEIGR